MGVALDETAVGHFSTYLHLLQRWGRKINLTSRLAAEEIIVFHFLDSLAGVPIIASSGVGPLIDLGTGAGFPALPLKIALPELHLLLVESVRKKVAFCQEVIRATGLADIEARWGRGEELGLRSEYHQRYAWAVSRAVGPAADIAVLALPFLRTGGRILLFKGEPDSEELRALDKFCEIRNARWELRPTTIPHLNCVRSLLMISSPDRAF